MLVTGHSLNVRVLNYVNSVPYEKTLEWKGGRSFLVAEGCLDGKLF